jgi:hypothetical protein
METELLTFDGRCLINTPLQRGGGARVRILNRFSGFPRFLTLRPGSETAEAVAGAAPRSSTPLKRGVNENRHRLSFRAFDVLDEEIVSIILPESFCPNHSASPPSFCHAASHPNHPRPRKS